MSEMVERAALAFLAECEQFDETSDHELLDSRHLVRVVIAGLREPTDAMIKAGAAVWDEDWCTETNALNIWQAMVDEALKG